MLLDPCAHMAKFLARGMHHYHPQQAPPYASPLTALMLHFPPPHRFCSDPLFIDKTQT